jgi:CheY-like chemotaxis protein
MMMAAASRARGKTILVIDDDPDIVRIIRYMLRDAGCQVSYAYNGADGIQKAKAEKPDLVLTDLSMPNVSGIEVIDALHNDPETQHIPILAVTGHAWTRSPRSHISSAAWAASRNPLPVSNSSNKFDGPLIPRRGKRQRLHR